MSTFDEIIASEYTAEEETHVETLMTFERDYHVSLRYLQQVTDHMLGHVDNVVALLAALETVTDEIADAFGDDA